MRVTRRRLLAAVAALSAAGAAALMARAASARYYHGPVSDHFDGTRFFDVNGAPPRSLADVICWRMSGAARNWPAWSASPHSDPGIAFDALPPIDAVLVSHCHYDHLDLPTLSRLAAVHAPRVIAPLGNDTIMRGHDKAIAAEAHDWGDRVALPGGAAVTLVPVQHWSGRGLTDRNKALWAAFIIETPAGRIFHVPDSGYGGGRYFRRAREQYGPFRLAVLPIGAYEPRWMMRDQHLEPAEAVQAFLDSGADLALAHHFGTFPLTDEAIDAPTRALAEALSAAGIAPERFRALQPGQVWQLD